MSKYDKNFMNNIRGMDDDELEESFPERVIRKNRKSNDVYKQRDMKRLKETKRIKIKEEFNDEE